MIFNTLLTIQLLIEVQLYMNGNSIETYKLGDNDVLKNLLEGPAFLDKFRKNEMNEKEVQGAGN